jgi:UDP-N-acetylmuramyl pentapeptide phosphotransferase/UDP-N-acetylglucosamine-1-phosphate transferase
MYYFYNILISISIIILLFIFSKKTGYFLEEQTNNPRKIHKFKIIRIGSLSFLSILILHNFYENIDDSNILLVSFLFLIIGFIEDVTLSISNVVRMFLLIITIIFCIINNNLILNGFENEYLNQYINIHPLFMLIFSLLGFLILINGLNFIDGMNGLLLGSSLLILLMFFLLSYEKSELVNALSLIIMTTIISLFIFNFFTGKIYAGDSGAYFLGFLIGSISIISSNEKIIDEFLIACIIFYPVAELTTTFFRRIFQKKNPFNPDEFHLHTILYKIIEFSLGKNEFIRKNNLSNSITSTFILVFLFLTLMVIYLMNDINYFFAFIILNISYISIYVFIINYAKKLRLINNFF